MMQPILDYRADAMLAALTGALEAADEQVVLSLAEDIFGIDTESGMLDDDDEPILFDKTDAIMMIEGRMLDAFARVDLAKFSYVDYAKAKADGIVS